MVRPVDAIHMPVLSATQLMMHKLLSYTQHYCDFATGLPVARSLREQIDWDRVRRETAQSPYAEAFLVLLDRLDVVPAARRRRRVDTWGDEMTNQLDEYLEARDPAPAHRERPASPNRASRCSAGSTRWCSAARWRARSGATRSAG